MRRTEPETDYLLLYGWGFLVSAAGASSVLLSARWPALTFWTLVLLAVGFATSWRLRNARVTQNTVTLVILGALLLFMVAAASALEDVLDQHPRLSELGQEGILALMILAFMILRSYALYNPGDVVFSIVPGIAAFGLLAGTRAEPAGGAAFVVFVFASVCLASHEHYLSQRDRAGARTVGGERIQWMVVVSGLSLAALTIGFAGTLAVTRVRLRVPMVAVPEPPPKDSEPQWLGLASESFLEPKGTVEIGTGPLELSERIVFTVESDEPHYWRMRTYERYNGRGWRTYDRPIHRRGTRGLFQLPAPPEQHALKPVHQTFSFQVPTTVLVGAPQPVRYDLGEGAGRYVQYLSVDESGGARVTGRRSLAPYARYAVLSLVPPPVRVPQGGREPPLPDTDSEYLMVPFEAQKVADPLARSLTLDRPTVAGKALALMQWVANHGEYDLDAPAVPEEEDVVAYFLRSDRPKAYCDVFASALAILCRAAGVPSRFAVGFLPGELDTESETTVVRDDDRHAWAEVYIPGQGWTPLDATPPASLQATPRAARVEAGGRGRPLKWIIIPPALLAAAVLAWALRLRRFLPCLGERLSRARYPAGARGSLMQLYARALYLLAGYGLRRQPSQTPVEYLTHLRASVGHVLGGWLDSLAQLTQDFMHARYSARPVPIEQVERARAIVRQGERELRRNRRLLRRTT